MDTKALRQKVLDLAIRGKLVPQYPNDEPASVLLERIRQQKQQMVEEGKLKAKDIKNDTIIFVGEDNLHYEKFADGCVKCIEDEIPFDLPDGWAWCRLQSIATIQSSKRVFEKDYVDDGIPFYRSKEIGDLSRNEEIRSQLFITESHYLELKDKYGAPQIGDILITSVGSIGNTWICDGRQFYYKDGTITQIVANSFFVSEYVQLFLKTDYFFEQVGKTVSGSAYNALTIEKLKNILFALPPYNEQQRIVNALKPYNELVETVEVSKTDLLQLLSKTKAKILDLAIRGQLVPQDPSDEPVSVLLERIRAGKEELIKQGKIKRDKKQSVIFRGDDNSYYLNDGVSTNDISEDLPFDIPDSWSWGKLKDIVMINPRNKLDDDTDVAFIPMPLIEDGFSGHHASEVRKWKDIKAGFTHFKEGDVGVAKITPCFENRKSVIFENLINGYGAGTTELYIFRPYNRTILSRYLLAYMKSAQFIENGKQTFSGAVGQQRISKEYVENAYFPIPPLAEQERIVHQLAVVFNYLNIISEALS